MPSRLTTMAALRCAPEDNFVEDWPNEEGPLSDVDADDEAADLAAAAAGDNVILKRVILRIYGRAGRRARQRRRAEGRIAIAVNRAAATRYFRTAAAVPVGVGSRPIEQSPTSSAVPVRGAAPLDDIGRYAVAPGNALASTSGIGASDSREDLLRRGELVGGSPCEKSGRRKEGRVVQPDDGGRRVSREGQRTMFDYMRSSRQARAARTGAASLPDACVHERGTADASRHGHPVLSATAPQSGSMTPSFSSAAVEDGVHVTVLPAAERLPSVTAYTSLRRSWRRVEGVTPVKFTPYLGPSDEAHATAAKIMCKNGWVPPEWNSDGSDASDPDTYHHDNQYRSLSSQTFRLAQRAGVAAVVDALGESSVVVSAMSSALGETIPFLTHVIHLIHRRAADHRRAHAHRAAHATRRSAIERLTGGASLAVVLGAGAVREQVVCPPAGECVLEVGGLVHEHVRAGTATAVACAVAATAAGSDALAAGLPPASRAWAAQNAALVRGSHADSDALRADAAALRSVHAVLRAPDGPNKATLLPCMGTLFSADHVEEHAGADAPDSRSVSHSYASRRDVFMRLLCRTCLRYACRIHRMPTVEPPSTDSHALADADLAESLVPGVRSGSKNTASGGALPPPLPLRGCVGVDAAVAVAPVAKHPGHVPPTVNDGEGEGAGSASDHSSSVPARLPAESVSAAPSTSVNVLDAEPGGLSLGEFHAASSTLRERARHGRLLSDSGSEAEGVGAGSALSAAVRDGLYRGSKGLPAAAANLSGGSSGVLDLLRGGLDSLSVHDGVEEVPDSDVPVCSRPSTLDARRGRHARNLHAAIASAASGCLECCHDARVKAAMTYEKPTIGGWSEGQVALLHLGADIFGADDTCRLARFVRGKTCRGIADFISTGGWNGRDVSLPQPPDQDVDVEAPARVCRAPVAAPGAADAHVLQLPDSSQTSPPLSLGELSSSGRIANASSQEDPDAPEKVHDFVPCFHIGACTVERCRCAKANLSCERSCWCARGFLKEAGGPASSGGTASALIEATPASESRLCDRRTRCACVPPSRCATDECPCFGVDRECDPDACVTCGAHWHPDTGVDGLPSPSGHPRSRGGVPPLRGAGLLTAADVASGGVAAGEVAGRRRCRNVQLQIGARVRCVLGRSGAHGFGVFAAEPAAAGDFVGEYVGELVSNEEARARGRVYDAMGVSFLYSITKTVNIDAKYMGNRTKFINHRGKELANVEAKLLNVSGEIRVGLFAKTSVTPGEELFFDYGYDVPGWV